MKALFIEIRGILNQYRGWRSPKELEWSIDTDRVLDLKRIVDKTGANIILFDSWREHWYDDASLCTEQGHFLCEQLAAAGLKISGKTKRHANDDLESEFDDVKWVDYVRFNQRYRPDELAKAKLVDIVTDCCGTHDVQTIELVETWLKVTCPKCGTYTTFKKKGE